jgi:hypothetical protein
MLKKTLISLLILACLLVLPIVAQTPPAPPANETMGTNPAATHKLHRKTMHAAHHSAAYDDATRLAALLADTQGMATLSPAAWKSIANEANARANKLYAATSGKSHTAAKEARTHVREMHKAAMKGDANGAKSHAALALSCVYQIIDATGSD